VCVRTSVVCNYSMQGAMESIQPPAPSISAYVDQIKNEVSFSLVTMCVSERVSPTLEREQTE
jgi:hypothetical protein